MSLPKKLYRLHLLPEPGKRLGYAKRGGGTFNRLEEMQYRIQDLERQGRKYEIYETDCNWKRVEE